MNWERVNIKPTQRCSLQTQTVSYLKEHIHTDHVVHNMITVKTELYTVFMYASVRAAKKPH